MDDLIASLVADLRPVERLRSLFQRSLSYLALALAAATTAVLLLGLRGDLAQRVREASFLLQAGLLLVAFGLFSARALALGVPGARRRDLGELALAAVVAWIVLAGQTSGEVSTGFACLLRMLAVAAAPAIILYRMQRSGARSRAAAFAGVVAVGVLAVAGAALTCGKDASAHVFLWHAVPVALVAAWWRS